MPPRGVEIRCDPEALNILRSLDAGKDLVHGELAGMVGGVRVEAPSQAAA